MVDGERSVAEVWQELIVKERQLVFAQRIADVIRGQMNELRAEMLEVLRED